MMSAAMIYRFETCELDLKRRELRRDGQLLRLEPQVFDVLVYLVENRERMVGKEEILEALWPGRIVTDSALSSRIKTVRQAIGDSGREQRLLRTLHGRGFRFVGDVEALDPDSEADAPLLVAAQQVSRPTTVFGRGDELQAMRRSLERALSGERQILFLRGPAGAGKSALLADFLNASAASGIGIGQGQCVEFHGECEAFLPVLMALSRRCQAPGGDALVDILLSHAPTWAMQLPALLDADRLQQASIKALGANRDRMLRELGDAIEAWTRQEPLLIAIEDLHWADPSTLGLIEWLARSNLPSRLLLLATLRAADGSGEGDRAQALADELGLRGLATRIVLEPLTLAATGEWMTARFDVGLAATLTETVHTRTGGHPLWLSTLLEDWIAQGMLRESGGRWELTTTVAALSEELPVSLRQLIERQFHRLSNDDRALLDAAAVHGPDFCADALADMLDWNLDTVEARCEALAAAGGLIRDTGLLQCPNGRVAGTYDFVHQLYQEVLYSRLPPARRARLHQRMAEGTEARFGERAHEVASQIGMHFLRGHYAERAIRYLTMAAQAAFNRTANAECLEFLRLAEGALPDLPPGEARLRREREIRTWIGSLRMLSFGFADPEAEQAFRDANRISEQLGENPATHPAFFTLAAMHEFRGEFTVSYAMMQQRVAHGLGDGSDASTMALRYRVETHELMACSMFYQGVFERSVENADEALAHYDPERLYAVDAAFGANPAINCRGWRAFSLCLTGHPDSALSQAREGMLIANRNDHQHSMVAARHRLALVHCMRGEADRCLIEAEPAAEEAERSGVPYNIALTRAVLGWAHGMSGRADDGRALIEDALKRSACIGAHLDRPLHLGLLAEVCLDSDPAAALVHLDTALGTCGGERTYFWEPELRRQRALALHALGEVEASREALDQAMTCAESSGARWLALRVAFSCCSLFPDRPEYGQRLQLIDAGLHEGESTPLRQAARRLLAAAA
jgi:DNA-binding winged helix-turn-helix (wHTH) protein/tetratricopeptide (TPR) repeat protein